MGSRQNGCSRDSRIMIESVKSLLNAALGFVYPEVCQLCETQRATPAQRYVCDSCAEEVRFIKAPYCARCGYPYEGAITNAFECGNCRDMKLHFSSARSAVVAGEKVLEIIHRYKYNRALWFEPLLADWLARSASPELRDGGWNMIVPVPLHPVREREREFNQAQRLSVPLADALGISLETRLLRRVLPTQTQTRLSREERLENVRKAFAMSDGVKLSGERIVLIDDVMTTGATTSACAKVLKAAGAGEVCVWTVARGT